NIIYAGIHHDKTGTISIMVYPDPFSKDFTIEYSLLSPSKVMISLQDITGKEVGIVEDNYKESGTYLVGFNAEKYQLHPGIYILQFITEEGNITRKLVKF